MPKSTTLYAIRHVPTGKLMPARIFRTSSGGYTYWEPTDTLPGGYGGYNPLVPRFFCDKSSAALAVSYWLKGPYRKLYVEEPDTYFDGPGGTYQAGVEATPTVAANPRNPGDLEIVTFTLTESTK
jgi:hypothetical protein